MVERDGDVTSDHPNQGDLRLPTRGRRVRRRCRRGGGVSISTVSLVVNDKWEGRVAPDTVAHPRRGRPPRVRGRRVERRLAIGAAGAVAVVTPAFTNPFYARVSVGAAAALDAAYQVVFSVPEIDEDPVEMLVRLRGLRLAGVDRRAQRGRAPVAAGRSAGGAPRRAGRRRRASAVDLDVADGAVQVAEHLLALGHRRVAFMAATPETDTFVVRRTRLRDARGRWRDRVRSRRCAARSTPAPHRAASAAIPALLGSAVTAVVCATDLHAYGLLRACGDHGVEVPGRWSVVGFDDQPLSAFLTPPLTSVSLPADELGRSAGTLLAELIAGGADAEPPAGAVRERPSVRVLPVSLAVRASTGPAAPSA
ncbi:MAG: substrate-binding domain-containing protein [Ilumatobacteraceae bacterium]